MKTKTLFIALFITGLTLLQSPGSAAPTAKKMKYRTWEKEVAHYLTNVVLPSKLNNSLVIIRFTVDQARTIQTLDVYSDNKFLKEAFEQRLLGKSLNSLSYLATEIQPAGGEYLLKVHLKVS